MPFGPPSLWADRLTRLACQASGAGGAKAADWTASVWKGTPRSRQMAPISATGWIVPTSLLADWMLTRVVRSVILAAISSGSTRPCESTETRVISNPWRSRTSAACSTALCSTALVIRCRPLALAAQATPLRARLSASVPPEVKTISRGFAPSAAAIRSRASSSPWRARRPEAWMLEGLPWCSVRYGSIASSTSGRSGEVAA